MIINWLMANNAALNTAMNVSIACGMLFLAIAVYWHYRKIEFTTENSALHVILLGVIVEALGWAANRTWWAMSWYGEKVGWAMFHADSPYSWLSLIPLVVSMSGLVMIISPMVMRETSNNYLGPVVVCISVFSLIFTLVFALVR